MMSLALGMIRQCLRGSVIPFLVELFMPHFYHFEIIQYTPTYMIGSPALLLTIFVALISYS